MIIFPLHLSGMKPLLDRMFRSACACVSVVLLLCASENLHNAYASGSTTVTASSSETSTCQKLMDWPVREVQLVQDFDRPDKPWLAGHRGVDLKAEVGEELLSPSQGSSFFCWASSW